jgi:uncharacterized protein DUF2829
VDLHDIGWAVRKLGLGEKVYRIGWNGVNQYIEMMKPITYGDGSNGILLPYVFLRTPQNDVIPWTCSQLDLLAVDWELYP